MVCNTLVIFLKRGMIGTTRRRGVSRSACSIRPNYGGLQE
ncbi:hypothetical protein HMPREF0239_00649 [Clostridium sp. ATCC BAA-442]|nr:hypothetical protein HMPREF0239_00649 [Clostridium sp. ATCC BAA-442]